MVVWFVLQAIAAGPHLDEPRAARRCPPATVGGEVVVCGRADAQERFRVRALPDRYGSDPAALPRAQTSILGGRAALAAQTEAASVGGVQSNRLMLRLKIPLGK